MSTPPLLPYPLDIRLACRTHEWFQKDLPPYLFPPVNESEASIVDIDAVRVVAERCGVAEEDVTTSLLRYGHASKQGTCYDSLIAMIHIIISASPTISSSTTSVSPMRVSHSPFSPRDSFIPYF